MFTRQTLVRLSTSKVFDRGDELWQSGAVKKLSHPAPTRFSARVRGTSNYHTEAWLASGEVEFSCDCPYAFEGICKHAVALGLAILDTYGSVLLAAPTPAAANNLPQAIATAWAAWPDALKLDFLRQALGKNDDLARQFLAFGTPLPPAQASKKAPSKAPDPLKNLAERLTDVLSTLDFGDAFWEDHEEEFYNEEDNEVLNAAVQEALAPFVDELGQLARAGQLALALRYWATACAAIYQVEEPADDAYGSFDNFGTEALHRWHEALTAAADWPAVLLAPVLPPAETAAALAWLAAYFANPPARWPGFEESWLPLLQTLADEPAAAARLPELLRLASFGPATAARLHLRLAETTADPAAWVAAAEALLPTDAAVAQRLLHHYATAANAPALLAAATTAFATWPDRFASYVLATFTPATAPKLCPAALRHRALANHSLPDFEALRPLLPAAEIAALVKQIRKNALATGQGVAFAANLLADDLPALRTFVLALEWYTVSPPHDAEVALAQLAARETTPLLLEMETRLPAYLAGRAGARRGAVLYERLARWLVAVRTAAPRSTEPLLRLAQALREEFRTLHGLRDALRREGFLT